jgi:hypothetical protein
MAAQGTYYIGRVLKLGLLDQSKLIEALNSPAVIFNRGNTYRLRNRVLFSLLLCLLCCIGTGILWLMSDKINLSLLGALYLICLGIAGFSTLSLILSEHTIKEILTRYA